MHHELEMSMRRLAMLMQTGYLPRNMMNDIQTVINAAMAWQIMIEEREAAQESNGNGK
jgi:hypothetical protein